MFPVDVRNTRPGFLVIEWDDGHESVYDLRALRKACPCATCRQAKSRGETAQPLRVLKPGDALPDDLRLLQAETVGRYALQFRWNDGHHEGIFSFDYLRKLCQCDACKSALEC